MSQFHITGGRPLEGEVTVQGAKNSVLPILAASLLAKDQVVLHNCPKLTDVSSALDILRGLGCEARWEGSDVVLFPGGAEAAFIPEELMRSMRSSVLFLGPLLARRGEARLTYPGGCQLGPRPIDLHLSAMKALGAQVEEGPEGLCCSGRLTGREVHLSIPSVGATENIMLAAMGASGTTTIVNAAREPEIVSLQLFLNQLGGRVRGAGSSVVSVEGGRSLCGAEHTVMGDRIVAMTLMSAAAAAGGEMSLAGVDWRQLSTVSAVLTEAGCQVVSEEKRLTIRRDRGKALRGVPTIRTAPYPGFPTDAQAPVMAALCAGTGCTLFVENVFRSRYRHVDELRRMGADITTEGRVALVRGVSRLHGAHVQAQDLRGGGALAAAALGAEGNTVLSGVDHIDRGYERLENVVAQLGGAMTRAEETREGDPVGKTAKT
jgi:UDP-N-acetylglucosamine 1-carboxyvinyltransferase